MIIDPLLKYREQHKHRLNYMPWLYWSLKPKHREWAVQWQQEYQAYLMDMETVQIGQSWLQRQILYRRTPSADSQQECF